MHRIWTGLLLVIVAAILAWRGASKSPHPPAQQDGPDDQPSSGNRGRPHDRSVSSNHARPASTPPLASHLELPPEIIQYLDAFDEETADEAGTSLADHVGRPEVETLILVFHQSDARDSSQRALSLLSGLRRPDALAAARDMVLREDLPIDDPVLLACATSLASDGGEDGIHALLERLNRLPMDPPVDVMETAAPLIRTLALVSAPELESYIGRAAEGHGIASGTAARSAAILALRSYPTIHSTSILARLRDHDPSPAIRETAADVLARIQSQAGP